ncbi:ExeM/NucH family extracellular endonuclease [Neolewinella aurantiaca]|uniref:ExeM/NucH family extracellular endonuclease n=1 Tax=Neolewinella aurantiaca TaxID=2602767 RepID=A0A5C7FRM1_9BACT|nr:ExeM/NucH family extracellular endonuclease [Neolewinella aurantiaca]TXF88137.1 ExeM/NucH family extracellular endonuclease [Neolewinella aurantiaca]
MRILFSFLAICLSFTLCAQQAILTGILDGDLFNSGGQGGNPKVIELYVNGSLDISGYQLSRTNATNVFTFPAGSTYSDEFVYVVNPSGEDQYIAAFGTSGDFANYLLSNNVAGNGDDPYQLLNASGVVLDQTGGPDGSSYTYRDGHFYRVDNTGPDGAWVAANWTGGNGTVDNQPVSSYAALTMFGTYSVTPPGPNVSASANGNLTEPSTDGGFLVTLSEVAAANVTVTYTLAGTAVAGADYVAPSGSIQILAGDLSAVLPIEVLDDADSELSETIEITLTSVSDATYSLGSGATINVFDDEPVAAILISAIQGTGTTSPAVGQTLTIEGIVVGDFQGGTGVGLGGFFVQEEDNDADANPMTSEGIWVYDNTGGVDVSVGDKVAVTGLVEESSNLTQMNVTGGGSSVSIVSTSNTLPTAANLALPVANDADYEPFEGMLTTITSPVFVTETFGVGRYGEFVVSEGERLVQYTECNEPDPAGLAAYNAQQSLRKLTVDDGRSGENVYPIVLGNGQQVTATNSLRSGSSITGLTGIIDERFSAYRMQATDFTVGAENARPTSAPALGGDITVVGMNVLNYFTTLNSRGANNQAEFDRQEIKIVKAICELDADIIGLVEIENNGYGANGALQSLIDAIAAECGTQYSFVTSPNTGGDEIQVALIYKPNVVMESGTAAALSTPANVFSRNRIPVAQTFKVIDAGNPSLDGELTVCVNHWKSKGSSCGSGDDDTGGAGNCDGSRTAAAQAIYDWLETNPTGTTDTDNLVIGDLNAYSQEAPITLFTDAGYVNAVREAAGAGSFPCGGNPSYVFSGEWGSLDQALASASLASQVTGAIPWPVNAPEPIALDYDTQYNDPALWAADYYRFSDHDPVVIGLKLDSPLPVELLSFTGQEQEGDVLLNWSTASEQMTERFDVQRRDVNSTFATIGTLPATGNSSEQQDYSFLDTDPVNGTNEYRLRIVDVDGSEAFSDIVSIEIEGTNSLEIRQVSPRQFRLFGGTSGAEYLFTNAAGAVLRKGTITNELTDIDGSGLPAGIYFLVIQSRNVGGQTFKIVLR